MDKYMHKATGSVDTREGWIESYDPEELAERELTAEEAFEEDEGDTLIAIVSVNGDETTADKVPQIIQDQPGYSGEGTYMVAKAATGGYRLYKAVGANWMDASLDDIPSLGEYVASPAALLGRKGGSIKSPAKSEAAKARNARRKAEGKPEGGRPKKPADK